MITTIIVFIIVLAILIFVHELGHFLFARACGVRVEAFAIGFGPKVFSWKRGETVYSLNIIPFGGYVKIFGENPEDPSEPPIIAEERKVSFIHKPRWQQSVILLAGIFFNFLFAWLLYFVVFISGTTVSADDFSQYKEYLSNDRIMITYVESGSPAEKAGLTAGDVIENLSVNGASMIGNKSYNSNGAVQVLKIEDIQNQVNKSGGKAVTFNYLRKDENKTAQIIPVTGLVEGKYAIGIGMQNAADVKLPFFASIYEGGHYTLLMIKETMVGLYSFVINIFKGTADFTSVTGPVGIAGIVGTASRLGFTYLLMIVAIISINLGVINLVPFPALDGGRFLFVVIESIIRRSIPARVANITNAVGFALLMALMVFVTYRDVVRLIVDK